MHSTADLISTNWNSSDFGNPSSEDTSFDSQLSNNSVTKSTEMEATTLGKDDVGEGTWSWNKTRENISTISKQVGELFTGVPSQEGSSSKVTNPTRRIVTLTDDITMLTNVKDDDEISPHPTVDYWTISLIASHDPNPDATTIGESGTSIADSGTSIADPESRTLIDEYGTSIDDSVISIAGVESGTLIGESGIQITESGKSIDPTSMTSADFQSSPLTSQSRTTSHMWTINPHDATRSPTPHTYNPKSTVTPKLSTPLTTFASNQSAVATSPVFPESSPSTYYPSSPVFDSRSSVTSRSSAGIELVDVGEAIVGSTGAILHQASTGGSSGLGRTMIIGFSSGIFFLVFVSLLCFLGLTRRRKRRQRDADLRRCIVDVDLCDYPSLTHRDTFAGSISPTQRSNHIPSILTTGSGAEYFDFKFKPTNESSVHRFNSMLPEHIEMNDHWRPPVNPLKSERCHLATAVKDQRHLPDLIEQACRDETDLEETLWRGDVNLRSGDCTVPTADGENGKFSTFKIYTTVNAVNSFTPSQSS